MRDVSIEFPAGTVTAIVGDNGAGKSTLVKMLCGAVHPDRGHLALRRRGGPLRDPGGGPGGRHRHRVPGPRPRRSPQRRREPVPRSRAGALVGAGALARPRRDASGGDRRARRPARSASPTCAARRARCRADSARVWRSPAPCTRARCVLVMDEPMAALGLQEQGRVSEPHRAPRRSGSDPADRQPQPRPRLPPGDAHRRDAPRRASSPCARRRRPTAARSSTSSAAWIDAGVHRRAPRSRDRRHVPVVVVVGAGPAGLTAAHRLRQRRLRRHRARTGADVRWADPHRAPRRRSLGRHRCRLAGQLLSRHARACSTSSGCGTCCRRCSCAAAATCCSTDGSVPTPNSIRRIATTRAARRRSTRPRFFAYMAGLLVRSDAATSASTSTTTPSAPSTSCGGWVSAARDRVVRPNFEGPFFARLEEMSAALVRVVAALPVDRHVLPRRRGHGRAVAAPRRRRSTCAPASRSSGSRPAATTSSSITAVATERFDGAIVAVPAPVAAAHGRAEHRPGVDRRRRVRHRTCASTPPAAAGGSPAAASTCSPTTSSPPSRSGAARSGRGGRCPPTGNGRSCALRRRRAPRCSTSRPTSVTRAAVGGGAGRSTHGCSTSTTPTSCS